ncbi:MULTISPECIES: hypothetical protein [unclassified Mycolicibacterium]|uniref:hypothetical protein n=1 Tax=unclassified Mycolicibacterium TaxID=2636767 RepID=UPI00224A7095|nr:MULTISPECIES: hypothetical protein [unclassified Mycolicibacterium]MCX2714942.1 hypothetical protein [Mycolicibacterium sp. J2]MDX1874074.1 hypothetical protein [Mycolicibacterium sp. 120266]
MASTGALGAVQTITAPAVNAGAVGGGAPAGALAALPGAMIAGAVPGAVAGAVPGAVAGAIPGAIAGAVPGLLMAPMAGAAGLAADFVPQPSLAPPTGTGGLAGFLPTPQLNMPALSGFGVPVPTQVSMPTDLVCEGLGWSASTPGTTGNTGLSLMPDAAGIIRHDRW